MTSKNSHDPNHPSEKNIVRHKDRPLKKMDHENRKTDQETISLPKSATNASNQQKEKSSGQKNRTSIFFRIFACDGHFSLHLYSKLTIKVDQKFSFQQKIIACGRLISENDYFREWRTDLKNLWAEKQ